MPRKPKTPVTDAQRKARSQNIIRFNSERGNRPALKSGIQMADVKNGKVPAELPTRPRLMPR